MKIPTNFGKLANQYLENIPIEKVEDFEAVKEALKSLLEPHKNHPVAPSLKNRVEKLKNILNHPEQFVQKKDFKGFRSFILQKVAAKIKEIEHLTPQSKEKYIAAQKKDKERAPSNLSALTPEEIDAWIALDEWKEAFKLKLEMAEASQITPEEMALLQDENFELLFELEDMFAAVRERAIRAAYEFNQAQHLEILLGQYPQPTVTQEEIDAKREALLQKLEDAKTKKLTPKEMLALQDEVNEIVALQEDRLVAMNKIMAAILWLMNPKNFKSHL